MSILTNWGYTLTDAEYIRNILTEDDFNEMTARKYLDDVRISPMIEAAEAAIRDYCGWHIAPSMSCSAVFRAHDKGVTFVGRDLLVQLPARYVSQINGITIGGAEWTDYDITTRGLLRIYDGACACASRKTQISVSYEAGLPFDLAGGLRELVMHRVSHALAQSYGVQSETAGGVSITYSANWINSARATALPADNKEVLEPYRVTGVY